MTTFALRRGERRRPFGIYIGPEHRSGFDRRPDASPGSGLLLSIRGNPVVLATLLLAINVMNLLDFLLTVGALEAGYAEGNPVMAFMFARSHILAGAFKLLVVAAATAVIWRMRRYRMVLQVAVFAFAVFAGVLLLHAYGRLAF